MYKNSRLASAVRAGATVQPVCYACVSGMLISNVRVPMLVYPDSTVPGTHPSGPTKTLGLTKTLGVHKTSLETTAVRAGATLRLLKYTRARRGPRSV